MPDPTTHDRDDQPLDSVDAVDDESDLENEPPDESVLLGASGVEQEVLAELARAEAELSEPNAPPEPPDDEGTEV
jgi:hypothetical protein